MSIWLVVVASTYETENQVLRLLKEERIAQGNLKVKNHVHEQANDKKKTPGNAWKSIENTCKINENKPEMSKHVHGWWREKDPYTRKF